jgi:tetratricopeptide (TPR) repeat protein
MINHTTKRRASRPAGFGAAKGLLIVVLMLCRGEVAALTPQDAAKQTASQKVTEVTTLELGKAIERELAGGQKQAYQLTLAEGQYARVTIEQRGIDVVARLLGPDGKVFLEFDFEIRPQGQEPVEWVAETAGNYRLSVEAKQMETVGANYRIRFDEMRPAGEKDRALQEARKLYAESYRLRRAGKYDEALAPGKRALEIQEERLGPEHPEVAIALNNLGEIHRLKADYATAESFHQRALEIRIKALGPDHPYVAYSLTNLGSIAERRGDPTKAKLLNQRALEIKEKAQGANHPDVATTVNNLAVLYINVGDFIRAEHLLQHAL